MIKALKIFFQERISPAFSEQGTPQEHALQLATAALLIEVMYADFKVDGEEQKAVSAAIQSAFQLTAEETQSLLALADEEVKQATDMFQFARLINKEFSRDRKVTLLEHLWAVAFADETIEKYEEHLIRKVTTLLHLHHEDFIDAKLRVKRRLHPRDS